MMINHYRPGAYGPVGRRPVTKRVFEPCVCGGTMRNGVCETPIPHVAYVLAQEQKNAQMLQGHQATKSGKQQR